MLYCNCAELSCEWEPLAFLPERFCERCFFFHFSIPSKQRCFGYAFMLRGSSREGVCLSVGAQHSWGPLSSITPPTMLLHGQFHCCCVGKPNEKRPATTVEHSAGDVFRTGGENSMGLYVFERMYVWRTLLDGMKHTKGDSKNRYLLRVSPQWGAWCCGNLGDYVERGKIFHSKFHSTENLMLRMEWKLGKPVKVGFWFSNS